MIHAALLALVLGASTAPQLEVSFGPKPGSNTCDELSLAGRPTILPALETVARADVSENAATTAVVTVQPSCTNGDVTKILDTLKNAGVKNVALQIQKPDAPPAAPTDTVRSAARGTNAFAVDLYGQLRAKESGNLFFSPLSVAAALSLVDVGAAGKTAQELDRVLHAGLPHADAHVAQSELVKRYLGGRGDVTLEVANRIWARASLPLEARYTAAARQEFGASVENVDFSNGEHARATINDWIKQETHGKIPELIGRGGVGPGTQLVLTNAVYFLGTWKSPFNPANTHDAPFTLPGGEKVTAPLMQQTVKTLGAETDEAQVVELPYGKSGSLVFDLVLPRTVDGLPALEKKLTPELLEQLFSRLGLAKVALSMPRFTQRSTFELASPLAALGLRSLFSSPDLSEMTTAKNVAISAVVHQAFVDVNEKGTEAAAATAVISSRLARRMPEYTVTADHPFLFFIRDTDTGGVLFMGRLADPRK